MNKFIQFAVLVLGLSSGVAHALTIDVTRMEFFSPGSAIPGFVNNDVQGVIDFSAGAGGINSGSIPLLFVSWTASVAQTWGSPGAYHFAGTAELGSYDYAFTLGPNQYAAGLMFNWSTNDIPVLAVFDCSTGISCTAVNTDGDASPGTAMQTAPFPGYTMAFSGQTAVSAVPVPAAAWLLVSGIAGLFGAARRQRC